MPSSEPARRRLRRAWPYGSGLPGFGAYRIPESDSSSEDHKERTEHDDPTHPAPTSDAQDYPTSSTSISKRCRKSHTVEPTKSKVESDDEPPELFKDGESSDDDSEHQTIGKMSSDPKSCESDWHFDMCPDSDSSDHNSTNSPMANKRNEDHPKYSVDEFENPRETMSVYIGYRIAGGKMKLHESDTGTEHYYDQFPGIELEEIGEWHLDYNNIAHCEWTMCNKEYAEWYLSTHPKPVDMREATRYWWNPGSYKEFLQNKAGNGKNYKEGSYDYISAPRDTWDRGSIYRMYMIRKQAAIDMTHKPEEGIFIKEQDIDDWLIVANDYADEDESSIASSQQQYQSSNPRPASGRNPTPTEPSTSTHCTHRA